ncbi:MAG: tRNA (adenosine(37)-N6)-dimethylallyltransferase MiaA [Chloroflexi bacterium]|nr:tRNA (adenosine(37)-N6)-dimethylallyltransferase MiaA [Chloroflexota bacterium]
MGATARPLVAIVGPTAVGKSDLALRLALKFGGEIVSADSRQVYRGMDIGTAKPTPEQRRLVPHHLVDILEPDQEFSLATFLLLARRAIRSIRRRGGLPVVAGGSGQYLWALLERWRPPGAAPDRPLRRELERRLAAAGLAPLVEELARLAPAVARRLDRRNPRRVLRALELALGGGAPRPRRPERPLPGGTFLIGLTLPRSELYRRIDERVDGMVRSGLVEEVRRLLERCGPTTPVLGSLGYGQLAAYLQGRFTHDEALRRIKSATHRFARQQHNWFRLSDPRIRWYNADEGGLRSALSDVAAFLAETARARPLPATS